MTAVTLKFEPDLAYQHDAVKAAVNLFSGMPLAGGEFSVATATGSQLTLTELGVGNPDPGDSLEPVLLANLQQVQEDNELPISAELEGPHFTIEMETGTGKTYVYLRTMFELHKHYGFTKFVIAVPSVAVREGVLASIELMRGHFHSLYSTSFDAQVYDSKNLGRVRQFATANTMQMLVLNIDAFRKDVSADGEEGSRSANVINRASDAMSGRRPIEFIKSCRPVVVVDEPQNMESEKAVAAIDRLNPMCTLRYSATHKKDYNPIYRLGPVEAHEMRLVKSIEVASVVEAENLNAAFVKVLRTDQSRMRAQLQINVGAGSAGGQKSVSVKVGDDLHALSDERQEYANGYIIGNISFRPGDEHIEFSSGHIIHEGETRGGFGNEVRRAQIQETVRQHLDRELSLHRQGKRIKVLSLIFLDQVANYRQYTDDGPRPGQFAEWFEEAYADLAAKPKYSALSLAPASKVHGGYFSKDKATRKKPEKLKDTSGRTKADEDTYELIMRHKERLLSPDEPLRFIFSHSALREGWDNPNVFQICTLNESRSADRKRQEIGRGLRLPVNHDGERIRDRNVNRLTVIANEAYEDFALALQTEYEEDTGRKFGIVERTAFVRLLRPAGHPVNPGEKFGADGSSIVWDHLEAEGIIGNEGQVLPAFNPLDESFVLPVPEGYEGSREDIIRVISKRVELIQINNARKRKTVRYRKQVTLDPDFRELWNRISVRTRYRVSLDTGALVADAVAAFREAPAIEPPKITIRVSDIQHRRSGLQATEVQTQQTVDTERPTFLPDILADLQNETDLTRRTIVRILTESGRLSDFLVNPQAFLQLASRTTNAVLQSQVLSGIEYEEIADAMWEMRRLEPEAEEAIERYASNLYKVQYQDKTPYDHVEFDSDPEHRFAKALDNNRDVRFYIKLPSWFTVDTPVGPYNPDWAIMFQSEAKLYLVRETKSSLAAADRREIENTKIDCAARHFQAIGVDYGTVTNMDDLATQVARGPTSSRA
ncbi:DEAD/DEAH box helicase family protein [Candidatus Poriferisodalis sp.]|uniref:restriction endonuclease n=1 Tax=Candidatus Poriferisodalis sp. TaxID=3101277 RepID=UPI003B52DB5F